MSKVTLESAQDGEAAGSQDRRRSTRAALIVRVDYGTIDEMFSEFSRDINEGGLFIETDKPKSIGTEVTLHFNLPGSEQGVQTTGRVVRVSSGDDAAAPGMGIEFDELTDADRARIDDLVRALRARRASP